MFEIQIKELSNGYTLVVWFRGNKESETFYQHLGEVHAAAKLAMNKYLTGARS